MHQNLPTTVFVDLSNIFYGAQESVPRRSTLQHVRLQYDALLRLALAGHPLHAATAVTTERGRNSPALDAAEAAGFRVLRSEPGLYSGREQNVDERLQLENRSIQDRPARVVLLTGDGHAGDGCTPGGFIPAVQGLSAAGSRVELLAWRRSCSVRLREAVLATGSVVNDLDVYWRAVTFETHGRRAEPLNLRHRHNIAA